MDHAQRARELFLEGCNCAQSVVGAFAPEMGLTQDSVKQYTPIIGNLKPLAKRSREEDMPEG